MKKFALIALAAASAAILGLTSAPQEAAAGGDCARSKFETTLVKQACTKGGQAEAKKAMKKFLSVAKKKDSSINCKSCHTSLSPKYELSADGLKKFKELGGK